MSTTGLMRVSSIARHMLSNMSREPTDKPDIVVNTVEMTVEQAAQHIIDKLLPLK